MKITVTQPPSKEMKIKDLKPDDAFMFVEDLQKPGYKQIWQFVENRICGPNPRSEARGLNGGSISTSQDSKVVRVYIEEVTVKILLPRKPI